jgi:hypothetical protein
MKNRFHYAIGSLVSLHYLNRYFFRVENNLFVQSFTKIKWDKVNFDCVIRYFCEIHLLGNKSVKNKKTILINVIIRQYFKNSIEQSDSDEMTSEKTQPNFL